MTDTSIAPPAQDIHPEGAGFDVDFSVLLRRLIGIIRHNALLIAGILVAAIISGVAITLLMTPHYEATSRILIEDQADQIIEGSDLQEAVTASNTERFLQTQLGIIQSRALASSVIQNAKLDTNPDFFTALGGTMPTETTAPGQKIETLRRDEAIALLLSSLTVTIPPDSRIATITINSRDPRLSTTLANDYAERFSEYNLNQKYDSSSYARQFLANQLEDARNKLTQSELELNQYANAAGLIRVTSDGSSGPQETALSVTNNQLIAINTAAANATAERIAAQDRWQALAKQPALSIPEVNANSAVTQLVTARAQAQADLAEELSHHQEGYATVKAKRAEIAELDQRINAIASSIKHSAQLEYETASKKEQSLLDQVKSLRSAALQEQDRGVQYSVLKRVADTNRALYESLLSRYNQLNASAGASSNNVTVVDSAVVPTIPSSPNLALNVFLAFVLGLLAAAIVVALRELLDDAIRSPEDVEKKLELPLLGLLPLRKSEEISTELEDPRSNINEAYRSLVTNLHYSTTNGLPQVLVVTSSRQGEGKSTTAKTIASDIAKLGKKTLLIDADLRRPTLHRTMNDTSGSGLTDFLIGKKTFDEVIHHAPDSETLTYTCALPIPPDPGLILAGPGVGNFIAQARERYEAIILDCPPLLGLSDAPLLAQHADGVLFVIDGSSFHRGAVKSALRRLAIINVPLLGVALNRFAPKSGTDDYAYYSYNYYSYGAKND